MKPCGVDPGLWITGADLAGSDIRGAIYRKVYWDRQFSEIQSVAFDHHLLPRGAIDAFDWAIVLASLTESCGKRLGCHFHCCGN
jgi:hypothetical protein